MNAQEEVDEALRELARKFGEIAAQRDQANELLRRALSALELYVIGDSVAPDALAHVHKQIVNYAP